MKSYLAIVAMTIICGWLPLPHRAAAHNLQREADAALEQKEYVKARYHYLKAYEAFAKRAERRQAVPAAVNVSALYHRENYYRKRSKHLWAPKPCSPQPRPSRENSVPTPLPDSTRTPPHVHEA